MSKNWYPVINYETCTECGLCVEHCSHGVYQENNASPKVINPEGCVDGCHGCGNLCPTESISYIGESKGTGCGCSCSCN